MTNDPTTVDAVPATSLTSLEPDPRRWWSLAVIAVAQLMIVLDASVVIVALPSAQRALHISTADRQWVLSAYTPRLRQPSASRWADRRLPRSPPHVHRRPHRVRRSLRPGRPGPGRGHALRRPGPAGCLRRDHGACLVVTAHDYIHRSPGAGPCLRHLRRHRGRRCGHRPRPGRHLDPVGIMALDPAHQRTHRHCGCGRRHGASSRRAGCTCVPATTSRER